MPQPIVFHFRAGSGRLGWLTILTAAILVTGIVLLIAVVAFGVVLILAPIALIATTLYYLFPGLRPSRRRRQSANEPMIIDGEYRIVEPRDSDGKPTGEDARHIA